jgi:putative endonuclease
VSQIGEGYYIYMVECSDGSLYTGWTTDPQRRLKEHNAGRGALYTRWRTPVELRYLEEAPDRSTAQRRENAIKKLPRQKKLLLVESYQNE